MTLELLGRKGRYMARLKWPFDRRAKLSWQ